MISRINLDNYEAYVLDLLEGRLDAALAEELRLFLILHPELQLDLDAPLPEMQDAMVSFPGKQSLHREFSRDEELILSYMENQLSLAMTTQVETRLSEDPVFRELFQAFQKTRLSPEVDLFYPATYSLHKSEDDVILNHAVVRYMEKDMTALEEMEFSKELNANQSLNQEYTAFLKTKLPVERELIFPHKEALHKKNKVVPLFASKHYYAVAAVILLLLALTPLVRLLRPATVNQNQSLASGQIPARPSKPSVNSSDKARPALASSQDVPAAFTKKKAEVVNPVAIVSAENKSITRDSLLSDYNVPATELTEKSGSETKLAAVTDSALSVAGEEYVKLDFSHMIPFEEDEEQNSNTEQQPSRGFWKRATRLAKQVNQLGLKSVNGNETENNHFLISFNAVSIEKK